MPRKGENIYKRKDGRWEARYIKDRTPEGKAVYGYVYAKSYKEVKSKLQKHLTQEAHRTTVQAMHTDEADRTVMFRSIANDWLVSILPQVKESTSNKYSNLLNLYIIPNLGHFPVESLSYDMIEECANQLLVSGGRKGVGLSPKTVSDILSVVRNILKYATRNGNSIACDVGAIQVKRCPKEMRVLSRGEQDRLCQYLYSDLSACNLGVLIALFTGLRIGELCALRWEDISLTDHTIHIHHTLQRVQDKSNASSKTKVVITSPKSACSIRTIPLPECMISILKEYKETDTGFFLTNSTVRYIEPRTTQNQFKAALKRSAVSPANFHSLRHTFATRCVELGFDVKSLSEILGHASVNITMNRYVHPSLELKKENMQRLSELFAVK